MSFSSQVSQFVQRTIDEHEKILRLSAFDLFSSIVISTPVDTSALRNAWTVSHGQPDFSVTERLAPISTTLSSMRALVNQAEHDKDVHFTNSLPYAHRIEYDGWSAQAPAGMLRVNAARWQQIVLNNARMIGYVS